MIRCAKMFGKLFAVMGLAIFASISAHAGNAEYTSGEGVLGDKLLGLPINLPLPILDGILGADDFEPDNTPELAVWSGLQKIVGGLLGALLPTADVHNLHVGEDVDWMKMEVQAGVDVTVETKNVRALADTHLTVFRVLGDNEPLPTEAIPGAEEAWVAGPDGEILVPVAVNDDTMEAGAQGIRSMVQFIAPQTGLYYSRVKLSPKAKLVKAMKSDEETTYEYAATSKATMSSSLYCTLKDSKTNKTIGNAIVTLKTYNVKQTKNTNGVYSFHGLRQGTYSVMVEAPGYSTASMAVSVSSNPSNSATVKVAPSTKTNKVTEETAPSFDFLAPAGQLSLEEVLRLVQLYNAGSYHCDADSEDGFAAGTGNLECAPHALDADLSWTLDMSELLRGAQIFSMGGYRHCEAGEGGFCAGQN